MGLTIANKEVKIDNQLYLAPSWEDTGLLCFSLAQKILPKNIHFDRLIALVKGGLTWSRALCDYLNIKRLSAFQVEFYSDVSKTNNRPIIVQSLPAVVEGETLLLIDDVVDSGETIKIAKEYLYMCGAKKVVSCSLFIKSWAKEKPDYYIEETNAWIIFPHEVREMIMLLNNSWRKKGVNKDQIKKRFYQIGLSKKEVDYFLK